MKSAGIYIQWSLVNPYTKELGTVNIAYQPCPLAKLEVPQSSYFLVGIICLTPPVYRSDISF
jgi:hypothetical protein